VEIILNGKPCQIDDDASVAALLTATEYARRKVAVEINREIVPKSQHAERRLRAGDRVEIVQAMGGG
jgi:sulfur carrier protein